MIACLTSWICAGVRHPLRALFLILLLVLGALALANLVIPLREAIPELIRQARATIRKPPETSETAEVRSRLRELKRLVKAVEQPMTESMEQFSTALDRRFRFTRLREQVSELQKAETKEEEKTKWNAILKYYDDEIAKAEGRTKDLSRAVLGLSSIESAIESLRTLPGAQTDADSKAEKPKA